MDALQFCTLDSFALGIVELKMDSELDLSRKRITDLFKAVGNENQVACFVATSQLKPYLQRFHIMAAEYKTDTFISIWKEEVAQASSSEKLEELVEKAWSRSFGRCENLLHELQTLSIAITDVDKHYKHFDMQHVKVELEALFCGVSKCKYGSVPDLPPWISETVKRIQSHYYVCKYTKAANSFLQLKEFLKLKGDFQKVEKLSSKVSVLAK